MPWEARCPSTRSIIGTPTIGSICLGAESVRGRSLVPSPPTRTTAFITWSSSWTKVSSSSWPAEPSWWWTVGAAGGRGRGPWESRGRRDRRLVAGQHLDQRRMVEAGGFGSAVPSGANPTVISWRFRNLRSAGFSVVTPPVSTSSLFFPVLVVITQVRAWTTPTLPASGVPAGHFWPFLYSGEVVVAVDGYLRVVLVSVSPVYPLGELPEGGVVARLAGRLRRNEQDAAARRRQPGRRGGRRGRERRLHGPADVERQAGVPRRPDRRLDDGGCLVVVELGQGNRPDPDQDDHHERGIPVHRHLPAVGGAAARCGGACDRFPRGASRHGGWQPYSLEGCPPVAGDQRSRSR